MMGFWLAWVGVLGWSAPPMDAPLGCGSSGLWVGVTVQSTVLEPRETLRVVELLRAYLGPRRIEVCVATVHGATRPAAIVGIGRESQERLSIAIEIQDDVTNKRVVRELELEQAMRNSWPVILAVAADELLRASWAELSLPELRDERTVAVEVRELVTEQTQPRRWFTFGGGFAYEYYRGGQQHLGGDVSLAVWPVDRFAVHARVGFRRGLPVSAPHGTIDASAAVLGLGVTVRAVRPTARVGVDVKTAADLVYVFFQGRSQGHAKARAGGDLAVTWNAGTDLWVRVGERVRIFAGIALGVVARPVHASDAGEIVTSVSGLAVATSLGVVGAF